MICVSQAWIIIAFFRELSVLDKTSPDIKLISSRSFCVLSYGAYHAGDLAEAQDLLVQPRACETELLEGVRVSRSSKIGALD
jgi:hypothetical protein